MLTGFSLVAGVIIAGCIIIALYLWFRYRAMANWHRFRPIDVIYLKDGSVAESDDFLMRRRLEDGTWAYR